MTDVFSGMFASAVAKVARDKLVIALGDPTATTMPENLRRDMEEFKERMDTVAEVVGDADARSAMEGAVREWLIRLEDAAYGIWDMVDEIQANKGAPVRQVHRPCLPVATAHKWRSMASRMHEVKQTLDDLLQPRLGHQFSGLALRREVNKGKLEQSVDDAHPITPPFAHDNEDYIIVGRGEEKREIMDFIFSATADSSKGLFILSIVGVRGIGKTTLAKMVFNDAIVIRDYARVWVTVGMEFDLKKIGNRILSQLSNKGEHQDLNDLQLIMKRLDELLGGGNKTLVVLDDLWETDINQLENLKRMLGAGKEDRKVIVMVTTRNSSIDNALALGRTRVYLLEALSVEEPRLTYEESWHLLNRKLGFPTFDVRLPELLEDLMVKIVDICNGIPLAIHALGYTMRSKSPEEIRSVLNSDMWEDWDGDWDGDGDWLPGFPALILSYKSMPPNLRLCFAYCATFPRGHSILKDDLILHWTALQLLEPSDRLTTTQLANRYIDMLLGMSFLQRTAQPSNSGKHDANGVISFTMCGLIHSFVRSLMSSTLVVADGEYNWRDLDARRRCRCAVLTNFDLASSKLSGILPGELRSLSLLGYSKMELSNDLFSFAKNLRILELREPSMHRLPDSICQMGLLGYLNLSGCSGLLQLPESFGNKLKSVTHINLSGCSGLKNLPNSFGNLTSVVHINLSGCHGLDDLSKSFGKLTNLEYLDLSFCSCLRELQTALGGLTNLRHLNLSNPSCYALEQKDHLEQLKDAWEKLAKLQYLNLSMFMNPIFCYLQEGESLDCFQSIFKGLSSSLEHLDLSHNIFLVDLPETLCDLSKLGTLNLSGCIRLKRIPERIAEMKCLKTLILRKCPSLESYSFVVHADDGAYSSNLVLLEGMESCKELEISCLEKVKSVEDAKRITLKQKRLEKLTLGWTGGCHVSSVDDDEALLAELVPPPQCLQHFALKGYGGKCLPAWLTSSIRSHLPNLVEVTMEDIPRCSILPPFFLLPNMHQLTLRKMASITKVDAGELTGGNRAELHRLMQFTLDDMENLQEFNTIYCSGGEEFMFPTIDELVIQNCPNMKFAHLPPTANRLRVSASDQVMSTLPKREAAGENGKGVETSSSSTSSTAAAQVTQLVVENCKVPLGEWSLLCHLPGLRSLEIKGCNDLTGSESQEIIQALSSFQSLCFYQCNGMTFLPEYLGNLTSLQELTIHGCRDIKFLPDSIAKLSNLKDLRIPGCPELKKWCESESNRKKLAQTRITYEDSATVEPGTTANHTTNKQFTRGQSSLSV